MEDEEIRRAKKRGEEEKGGEITFEFGMLGATWFGDRISVVLSGAYSQVTSEKGFRVGFR